MSQRRSGLGDVVEKAKVGGEVGFSISWVGERIEESREFLF